ncbi:MAG TPA: tetratricopeptide repeat protein [Bryobacteraceae bacterium]|nr:tetratricopeptide repeat protein [Bryobacteraceae bacterium]
MNPGIRSVCCGLAAFLASAITLFPQSSSSQNDPATLVREGRKLSSEGKQDEALDLYRRALETAPNSVSAHLAAGIALDLKGQYADARKHIEKAIELAGPEPKTQALRTMAMSYAFERNGVEAAKYEQQIFDSQMAKQNFNAAAETADELGRIELESGDFNEAYKWYRTGHETAFRNSHISPAERDLWDFRWEHAQARIAARRGQFRDAQAHVAAAKAILDKGTNPAQARFYPYLTGYVAFYAGDYKTAIGELQKADQHDPFILSLIAQSYEKSGDKTQAMEYYRRVLASNIHNPANAFARPLAQRELR